jgi:hypothetical protein
MPTHENTIDCVALGIIIWAAILLFAYSAMGVAWFAPGNFEWREAMSYHGIVISAWMLLNLGILRYVKQSSLFVKLCLPLCAGALAASLLSGFGGLLIRTPGMSIGTLIQIAGMFLGDIVGIITLILTLLMLREKPKTTNPLVLISLAVCLVGIILSTPLGHFAGAIRDFGNQAGFLSVHARMIGKEATEALDLYVGSHGHQMVSAFICCAMLIPFLKRKDEVRGFAVLGTVAIFLATASNLAQIGLYQYSAWTGWEPPDLFKSGPNGMPLDDLILSVFGFSLLLLVPSLLARKYTTNGVFPTDSSRNRILALVYISYLITMVGMGVYIEFHEELFGGANPSSGAPWVNHDLAFIRAHLIYGCMLVPLIMSLLVNLHGSERVGRFAVAAVVCVGTVGVFVWTFYLKPLPLQLSFYSAAVYLLISARLLWKSKRHGIAYRDRNAHH